MSCLQKHYVSRISLLILVFKRQGSKTFNQDDRDDIDHSMSVDRHCHSFVGLIATPQVDTVCIKEFFYLSWLFSIFVQIFVLYFSRFVCVCPDFLYLSWLFFNCLGLFIFVHWPFNVFWLAMYYSLYNTSHVLAWSSIVSLCHLVHCPVAPLLRNGGLTLDYCETITSACITLH